jgi:type III secretion protein C
VAAAAAWVASAPALAGPPPWPTSQFSYYADGKPLHQVLSEFAAGFSLSLDMPTGLDAPVSGRLSGMNATEFIERLAGIYGFNWFTHAGTLYISSNKDMVVRTLPSASAGSGTKLRQVLTELRVLDPRFGWSELPDHGMVVVSGPPAYVRLVEATVAAIPTEPGGMQVSVFRLKHASAQDRAITFRDRQIVTPGVATILRNLVSGNTELALPSLGLIGNPVVALGAIAPAAGNHTGPIADQRSSSATGGGASNAVRSGPTDSVSGKRSTGIRPSIQSDARLNAIIVQDLPERLPIYQKLIATLDVPTSLIEIEAMIIDVNTNRLEELGISWHAVGLSGGLSGTSANTATIVANATRHFVSRLRMLEQQGDASILARPSILTTENIGAVIDLSETFYIQTTSERSAQVTPITAGTTLRITPRMEGEGNQTMVRLSVDIEDGQIQASSTEGGTPSVKRGVVSTEASVRKDESLLIGGYNSVQTVKGKVPLLGDLPLLGAMFSSTANQTQRRERLFLIRTKVLGSPPASGGVASAVAPVLLPATALPEVGTPAPVPAAAPSQALAAATAEIRASLSSAPETVAAPLPLAAPALAAPAVVPTNADAQAKGSSPRLDVGKPRDRDARRILRAELERAEQDLAARREKLSAGFDPSNPDERAANALARAATVRAQADIKALRRELSRLPGAAAAPR